MKKIALVLVLSVMLAVLIPAAAWAGEKTEVGVYRSVSGVWNTHSPEGTLTHKKVRFTSLDGKDEFFVESSLGDPTWPIVRRLKLYDRIWTGINSAGQIEVVFDAEPSAGVELGRTQIK